MLAKLGQEGGVRALLVMGSNLVVSTPNARTLQPALDKLDLLVVADLFLSETAQGADVVFPACQWAEEEGTMTNLEGRLLYRRAARAPEGDSRTDLQILLLLARALGRGQFMSDVPEDVFDELRKCSAGGVADYAGITYERLRRGEAIFWPCPSDAHPGTPRLFLERFPTPDGRARFHAVEHKGPAEETDERYPLYLTTGRVLSQYQSGTQTSRVASLRAADPEPFVEVHPHVAASYGIGAGDWVALTTRRGRLRLKARLNPSMRLDTVFVPFHWGGAGRANTLTSDALDPDSKIPEFKVAAVAIEKATPDDRGESMDANPRFIQGVFPFEGKGLESPTALPGTEYSVPADKRAQFVYLRAGNSAHELIYLVLTRDGKPMRYFPIGSHASVHVPLAVVEDIFPESKLGLLIGAPKGVSGTVVVDVGLLEVD
jgi:assimilatory nitrate reductase catalytic subunit